MPPKDILTMKVFIRHVKNIREDIVIGTGFDYSYESHRLYTLEDLKRRFLKIHLFIYLWTTTFR